MSEVNLNQGRGHALLNSHSSKHVLQAYVSVKRVTSMLMQDEIDPDAVDHDPSSGN